MKQRMRSVAALGAGFLTGILLMGGIGRAKRETNPPQSIKIGVSAYRSNDIFVSNIVRAIETAAQTWEAETGCQVNLDISGAQESQRTQNDQINRYLSLDYDVLCVNPVDRTNASIILDAAMQKGIPVIFFNREPVREDIFRASNCYYVGSDAKQTAVLQGEILAEAYLAAPARFDRNGDGVLQYVMLEGEQGHQDAMIRTEWSVQTLLDRGILLEQLDSAVASWDRGQAAVVTEQWLAAYGERIEAILCNNDEMALGAIEVLPTDAGWYPAVVGIDATTEGREAVAAGYLLGTVDCNAAGQGENIFQLAASLALTGNSGQVALTEQRYIRTPLRKVTQSLAQ